MSQEKVVAVYPVPVRNKQNKLTIAQQQGIDYYLLLEENDTTRMVSLEVKSRRSWYDDLNFEVWSSKKDGNVGWADDTKYCPDYFLYCAPKENKYKLYKWAELRKAWQDNKDKWILEYGLKKAHRSDAYSCAVPYSVLDEIILRNRSNI
jgi:hypothetical protein